MTYEAEGLDLIRATTDRLSSEGPFERVRDVTIAITDALMTLAVEQARRTGDHVRAVRIHPATLTCMSLEMAPRAGEVARVSGGHAAGFYGPAGLIRIIEDDTVMPGTFAPGAEGESHE